jgi:hypothetical protein
VTVSNLDGEKNKNLPVKSYRLKITFTTIKYILSSAQAIHDFFLKLPPEIYEGDFSLLLSGARILIFIVAEEEKWER